jgi:serine/threonine protein kinase
LVDRERDRRDDHVVHDTRSRSTTTAAPPKACFITRWNTSTDSICNNVDTGGDPNTNAAIGGIIGTPLYLSPEAIMRPDKIDARSDLYSIGAVSYFLLTGAPPFSGATIVEVCGHHMHTPPSPPSQRLGRAIPAGLEALVLQLLAKDPDRRPASAAALADSLAELVEAAPWSRTERAEWWARVLTERDQPHRPRASGTPVGFVPDDCGRSAAARRVIGSFTRRAHAISYEYLVIAGGLHLCEPHAAATEPPCRPASTTAISTKTPQTTPRSRR